MHAGGQRFDPAMLHQTTVTSVTVFFCVQALSLLIINNGSLFVVGRYYTNDLTHLRITQLMPGLKPQTSFGRTLARKTCLRAGYLPTVQENTVICEITSGTMVCPKINMLIS